MSNDGEIVLPAKLRARDGIRPGQAFTIARVLPGLYVLRTDDDGRSVGLIDRLLDCPAKGWFQPLDSEWIGGASEHRAVRSVPDRGSGSSCAGRDDPNAQGDEA